MKKQKTPSEKQPKKHLGHLGHLGRSLYGLVKTIIVLCLQILDAELYSFQNPSFGFLKISQTSASIFLRG